MPCEIASTRPRRREKRRLGLCVSEPSPASTGEAGALQRRAVGVLGAWRHTLGAGDEATGDEHADLPGDAAHIDWGTLIERAEDDLLDAAHDELGDDLGIEWPKYAQVDVR